MLLVVDANVLISALIAAGETADLLFCEQIQLIAPEFLFLEIEDHKGEIVAKSALSDVEVEEFLSLIKALIEVIPRQQFERYLQEANRISPDPDDTEYFALALRFDAILWSDDKELKQKQSKVRCSQPPSCSHSFRSSRRFKREHRERSADADKTG